MAATIADPITLPNGQTVKNRLVKAAMTEGLADPAGRVTPELVRLYERWADGGCGLLLTGNIQVESWHQERAGNMVVAREPDAPTAERLAALAVAGKRGGTRIWGQISHAGRQTPLNINSAPKAPSAVKMSTPPGMAFGDPVALTQAEVADVVERFVRTATVLKAAGFDGVQIHAAHGYLLSQFLSPKANVRDDQFGGALEGRASPLMEIVRRLRTLRGPDFGVSVKLNSADFQRGGFALDDSVAVARWLDTIGIDFLEISGGNYEAPEMVGFSENTGKGAQRSTHAREAYFLEFAPRIRAALTSAKLMVTGGFRKPAGMNEALADDGVDLIGIARPLCGMEDAANRLLEGAIAELPRYETTVQMGPGIFGQNSPFQIFKTLNGMGAQAWYYQNIVRLAEDAPLLRNGQLLKAMAEYRKRDAAKAAVLER